MIERRRFVQKIYGNYRTILQRAWLATDACKKKGFRAIFRQKSDPLKTIAENMRKKVDRYAATQ